MHICFGDIFWRGSLVDRIHYALVDGARGILPMGQGRDGLKITGWERDAAKLLHYLKGGNFGTFDEFFDRVTFQVTE